MTFRLDIEGMDELVRGANRGAHDLAEVFREILRGDFGDEIIEELRARVSDHTRTGKTLAAIDREETAAGVRIGVLDDRQHIGTWLESGTRMHIIEPRRGRAIVFNGRVVESSVHPGQRGYRIMRTTLRVKRSDAEAALIRGLERRLAPVMGLA